MSALRAAVVAAAAALTLIAQPAAAARKPPPPPPPMPADAPWLLQLPAEPAVPFRGVVNFDKAGVPHSGVLYPAPDPITFLAAIMIHGAINEAAQNSNRSKLEQEADRVLEPYRAVIDAYTQRELMTAALARSSAGGPRALAEPGTPAGEAWVLHSAPVFSMTQDQQALVLDNRVLLHPPGSARPAYANSVRVVSGARGGEAPAEAWLADSGAALKEASAQLFAQSVDVFLRDVAGMTPGTDVPQRTVRYPQGSEELFERARVLWHACDQLGLKTLRGWLMVVPAKEPGECAPAAPALQSAAAPPASEAAATQEVAATPEAAPAAQAAATPDAEAAAGVQP